MAGPIRIEAAMSGLLALHRESVPAAWVDYNGHLNDGFYMVIFSHATDALMDHLGLDASRRRRNRISLFTLEAHINYQREVKEGALARVKTRILGHDAKRLHIFHWLHADDSESPDEAAATNEQILLHVDMRGPKAAPFPQDILARIAAIAEGQAGSPPPANAGRAIRLARKA